MFWEVGVIVVGIIDFRVIMSRREIYGNVSFMLVGISVCVGY